MQLRGRLSPRNLACALLLARDGPSDARGALALAGEVAVGRTGRRGLELGAGGMGGGWRGSRGGGDRDGALADGTPRVKVEVLVLVEIELKLQVGHGRVWGGAGRGTCQLMVCGVQDRDGIELHRECTRSPAFSHPLCVVSLTSLATQRLVSLPRAGGSCTFVRRLPADPRRTSTARQPPPELHHESIQPCAGPLPPSPSASLHIWSSKKTPRTDPILVSRRRTHPGGHAELSPALAVC
jgi:hypothetical protein